LGKERISEEQITKKDMDIAKSAQIVFENILFNLLKKIYDRYKIENLTLSGGCAMNSVANGKILKQTPFKNIYISPNPGDAGGSVGSALVSITKTKEKINYINNYAYLGKEFNNQYIDKIVNNKKLSQEYKIRKYNNEDLINLITDKLIETKVIGWFQGKMEWGPRALGNRSIIADARNPNIKEIINSKIKRRESFRPFAPSILKEFVKEWFEEDVVVPYMSQVFSIKKKKKSTTRITHVDGTRRLQQYQRVK